MSGKGHPGYCKLCDSDYAVTINKLLEQGKNDTEVKSVIQQIDPKFTWTRQTLYSHKQHITHPLVTHEKQALANPVIVPKTNTGMLELIRNIGAKRAVEHPDEVTIDHALKAAGIMEQRREKQDTLWVVLAKAMTGELPPEEITGEYQVLPNVIEEEILNGEQSEALRPRDISVTPPGGPPQG